MNGNVRGTGTTNRADFLYLNRENAWLDFKRRNLDVDSDGGLRLRSLPRLDGPAPAGLATLGTPGVPAGLVVTADGTVFFADPTKDAIVRIDGCDGERHPVPCLGGTGDEPTRLRGPSGLAIHPAREALIVADAGNHRLQVFDLLTLQLIDVWRGVDTPWALAVDPAGNTYVVDRGSGRFEQFDTGGRVVRRFGDAVASKGNLVDPVAVAVATSDGTTAVYVLDRGPRTIVVLDVAGNVIEVNHLAGAVDPFALTRTDDAFYVGDNGARRVFRFAHDGTLIGEARDYVGPVAALALDNRGGLLVHPGSPVTPLRLALDGATVRSGVAWGGPFGRGNSLPKRWHRLLATMASLPRGAYARFSVTTTSNPAADPPVDESSDQPFSAKVWSEGPTDLGEFLIARPPAPYAWVGLQLESEGLTSPIVTQVRLDVDHTSYLANLPAIYREDQPDDGFLPRFLALAESLFSEVEAETHDLSRLADPWGAPAEFLPELARWLALDPAHDWDEAERREAIATALIEDARRGTADGLRTALQRYVGLDAWIEEPLLEAGWWALAGDDATAVEQDASVLGVTTMLAAAEPQGAVLGSTAIVNRSPLLAGDEYGMPLFDGLGHRFVVRYYHGATFSQDRLGAAGALLDREKPAHTDYHLCPVEPRMRIGFQARIGIDTVVAGDLPPTPLDGTNALGVGLVLGGEPAGQIGRDSRIGQATRLGQAAVGLS